MNPVAHTHTEEFSAFPSRPRDDFGLHNPELLLLLCVYFILIKHLFMRNHANENITATAARAR